MQEGAIASRAELGALARAFPGALRELDRVPLTVLEARHAALDRVITADTDPEPWMTLQCAYHGFMRAALRIRRLSRARGLIESDAQTLLAALPYVPAEDEPPVHRLGWLELTAIRSPPAGRLNPWVISQVARDLGVSVDQVELAVFPS